ncbi:MAG TPA: glycoside hydrolase family 125 protein [Chitinophagaceae bacterium]|nr:glycoside hydrolase family 125 protein [Chitinophagaceae bacterium]
MINRRSFIEKGTLATVSLTLSNSLLAGWKDEFPVVRVSKAERKFMSPAVESLIAEVKAKIGNKEIAWLFENCFPNTLDTTVDFEMINGKPDTFVITGDIDAMWLRDSSAQVWPYLPLMKEDKQLQELIKGVINRQTKCILNDPYANAFYKDELKISEWKNDKTLMKQGVHERKWETDSLSYPIRLAYGYWKETRDISLFDSVWVEAMKLVVKTFKEQQRLSAQGTYKFQRETTNPIDSAPLAGYGYPTKKVGLIHAMFRPSDDATVFPFNIPGNLFAVKALDMLGEILRKIERSADIDNLNKEVIELSNVIRAAIEKCGIVKHKKYGEIYAFETDGFGSYCLMDDSNVPSLLSLSYLNVLSPEKEETYLNTRNYVLSADNPFFFRGKAAEGIGGPHIGMDYIWPMSIIMRGITSKNDQEIKKCITSLQTTHGGTGFMHEAFHKDDPTKFTRKWFAWANTLFGEFIWKVYREKKYLLD